MVASLKIPLGVNFVGRFCAGVVSLIATPLYLHGLGVEGYGLVGFFLLLQSIVGFFSAGLADAANREIAAQISLAAARAKRRGFVLAAWGAGLVSAALIAAASEWIAVHWLSNSSLAPAVIQNALRWMAVVIGLQAPLDMQVAALLGAGRPVGANTLLAGTAVARAMAAVTVLVFGAATVSAFFWSQAVVLLVALLVAEGVVQAGGRTGEVVAVGSDAGLRGSWRFSAGMTAVAFTTMLLGQADRIVISRSLSLGEFGAYSIAATLANVLYFVVLPVQTTYYPAFSRHRESDAPAELTALYHQGCRRMAMFLLPVGAVLIFFAADVLSLWTHDTALAVRAAPVVMFLVGARLISGLNSLPYALQYSQGWTRLVVASNGAALVVFTPVFFLLARHFGAPGAAAGYFILSLPFLTFIVWRTHRRILRGQAARWWWTDTLPVCVVAFAIAGACRGLAPEVSTSLGRVTVLMGAGALTLGGVLLVNRETRECLRRLLTSWRSEVPT